MFPPAELIESPLLGAFTLLFALFIGHALADYGLQTAFISRAKARKADLQDFFGQRPPRGVWLQVLTAHCFLHAGAVWFITGSVFYGAVEFLLHWVIDYLKGRNLIGFHLDQLLHYGCKVFYVVAIVVFGLHESCLRITFD